jgi:hypothetical protein
LAKGPRRGKTPDGEEPVIEDEALTGVARLQRVPG